MNKNLFEEQLTALNFKSYDCLMAKYNPEFTLTAQYIEKITYKKKLSRGELVENYEFLNEYNKKGFNIYIRDTNYMVSPIFVLDDILASSSLELKDKIFSASQHYAQELFFIKTSSINKQNNYQVVFELKSGISPIYKHSIISELAHSLKADIQHAMVNKYFRAAGFLNKKPLDKTRFITTQTKNNLIQQYRFKP